MTDNYITFRNLPFIPDGHQAIYMENAYDTQVNDFIKANREHLNLLFGKKGFRLTYIPQMGGHFHSLEDYEQFEYNFPYWWTSMGREGWTGTFSSGILLSLLDEPSRAEDVKPCVAVFDRQEGDRSVFRCLQVEGGDDEEMKSSFLGIACEIYGDTDTIRADFWEYVSRPQESITKYADYVGPDDDGGVKHSLRPTEPLDTPEDPAEKMLKVWSSDISMEEDEQDEIVTRDVRDFIEAADRLKEIHGFSLAALYRLLAPEPRLSRMSVSENMRIFLTDYRNREILMTPKIKAVYILFLRHPEGIILKDLPNYAGELYDIYRPMRPTTDDRKVRKTIARLTDPLANSMNEAISDIRAAFVYAFDEDLAKNYYVCGSKGSRYYIPLDRKLVSSSGIVEYDRFGVPEYYA